jgi:hypothetical protein
MVIPEVVLTALREFTARIDALDPGAKPCGDIEVRLGGETLRLTLREPVAMALVEALRNYHDPRDLGQCDYCGGPRLNENFLCLDCGRPNGLFGQMIAERAARYTEPAAIEDPTTGRDAT